MSGESPPSATLADVGTDPTTHRPDRTRVTFGAFFMASGAALAVYIVSGVSLPLTFGLVMVGAGYGVVRLRRRLPADRRRLFDGDVKVGLVAGCAGLLAYDGIRWGLVHLGHFRLKPFDIFSIFGQAMLGRAIVGAHHGGWWVTAVGVAFHLANGLGFAVAYTVWLGRRGVKAGIAFALGLQCFMLALYPSWLRMQQLGEFVQISMIGHLAYGAVLGGAAKRLLSRSERHHGADIDS